MADYNLGTASGRIVVDGSGAEKGFEVAKTAAGAFFDVVKMRVQEVQDVGKRMAAVGAAGVAAFGGAVKVASSFEAQMSGVYAVANATEDQMDALRQKALDLGKETVYSASESASALEELIKAGISVEDTLNGAADAAVALASAGGVSIQEAAEVAANAMNSFELAPEQLARVADILAGVANVSATDVGELRIALSQAGAVANLAGLSFKDTAIAIGEMADMGIKGSDAGTSLKTMLNNLIPTTEKQSDKFKELGLLQYDLVGINKTLRKENLKTAKTQEEGLKRLEKYAEATGKGEAGTWKNAQAVDFLLLQMGGLNNQFFNAEGNVKKLVGIQATLSKALRGMSKEQKLSTLELLFGADAMRASAILSLEGAKGYNEFNREVVKTKAADVAAVRLDNLSGAVEQFKGTIETIAIEVGSVFLPVLTRMVQILTWVLGKFLELPDGVKKALTILGAFLSVGLLVTGMILAMLPAIVAMIANLILLRVIRTVTGSFLTFFKVLRGGLGVQAASAAASSRLATGLRTLATRSIFAGKMMLFFGRMAAGAWALATGPIGIAIAAIAALVGIGVILYKRWKPFRDLVDQVAAFLREKLAVAIEFLKPILAQVVAVLKEFGQFVASSLLPVLREVGAELLGKLQAGLKEIWAVVQSDLMPALRELGARLRDDVAPALQDLWVKIQPVLIAILKVYGVIYGFLLKVLMKLGAILIKYVLPILIKIAGFLGGVLIDTLVTLITGVIQVITGIVKVFTGLIDFFKGVFTGDWAKAWDGLKKIASGFLDLIIGLVKVWFSVGILKLFGLGFRGLIALVKLGWKALVSLFIAGGKLLLKPVTQPIKTIMALFRFFRSMGGKIISGAWTMIRSLFSKGAGALRGVVQTIFNGILTYIKFILTSWRTIFRVAWDAIKALAKNALQFIWATVKLVLTGIRTYITTVLNIIKRSWTVVWNAIKTIVKTVLGVIRKSIGTAFKWIVDMFKKSVAGWKMIISGAWNFIKNTFKNGTRAAINFVKSMVSGVLGFLRSLPGRALQFVKQLRNFVVDIFQKMYIRVINMVSSLVRRLVNWFKGLPGQIKAALAGLIDDMYNFGKDLIQGLINGVKNMADKLKDGIKDVVKGGVDAVGDFLGISSPSKLFRDYGQYTIQGQIIGQEDEEDRLIRSSTNLAKNMVKAFAENSMMKNVPDLPTIAKAPTNADTGYRRRPESELVGAGRGRGAGPNITVYNPVPEPASTSVTRRLRDAAEREGWN